VAGNGEFKYQSYVYRAAGFKAARGAAGSRPGSSGKSAGGSSISEQTSKAA